MLSNFSRFPFFGFSRVGNKVRGSRGVPASEDSGPGVEESLGSLVFLVAVSLGLGEETFLLEPPSLPGEMPAAPSLGGEVFGLASRAWQYLQPLSKLEPLIGPEAFLGEPGGHTVAGTFAGSLGTAAFEGLAVAGGRAAALEGFTVAGSFVGSSGTAGAVAFEGFRVAGSFAGSLGVAGAAVDVGVAGAAFGTDFALLVGTALAGLWPPESSVLSSAPRDLSSPGLKVTPPKLYKPKP